MTKAAAISLGLVVFLATTTVVRAQSAPADTAISEAVRRQANIIVLRQKLADAQAAQAGQDLGAAAKLYNTCYDLVRSIGPNGIEAETSQVVSGLTTVRMELARRARGDGNFKESETQVKAVLAVDPKNVAALELQKANTKSLNDLRGQIPDAATQERVALAQNDKIEASTLAHDGQILFEAGKLDEAVVKLKAALKLNPDSEAAEYYLNLIQQARYGRAESVRETMSKRSMVTVHQAWEEPTKRDQLPVPNPYARNPQIYTGKGRQAIVSKLDRIKLDSVFFDGLPLGEVVRNLSDEARKRDPEKRGINFIVNPNSAPVPVAAQAIDPATGLPVASAPLEPVDISGIAIKINPALTDVRLADVLDAIVTVADKPIKFSIEDYAVVFSTRGPEAQPLFVRTFKVDPNTFYQGLQSVSGFAFGDVQTGSGGSSGGGGGGGGSGNSGDTTLTVPRVTVASGGTSGGRSGGGGGSTTGGGLRSVTETNNQESVSIAVREFFIALGVDLAPPKNLFFNDRQGTLMVRATMEELDTIEQAIQVLNIAPPQVNIKTKFTEISQSDQRALGFDWYVGNLLMRNNSIVGSAGTAPSFTGAPSAANPGGVFPGAAATPVSPATAFPSSPTDQLLSQGLRSITPSIGSSGGGVGGANVPALATLTGILTDPQFRVVLRALDQRDGVDLLSQGEVTTLSGRQAQIQVVDIQTIVTGVDANQNTTSGGGGTTGGVGGGAGAVGSTIQYTTQPLPFGPVLDVLPTVSADGFTIQLVLIPTITEFVGYDNPGQFVPQAQSVSGGLGGVGIPLTAQLPLPRFRLRQVTTSTIVWDGQTVVLGGLISEGVARTKDKVPFLGDLPYLGKLFRSESSTTAKKNLVIFVTPTIIDPSGNRVHTEDEMPFAQAAIPPQANEK